MKSLRLGHMTYVSNRDPRTQRTGWARGGGFAARDIVRVSLNVLCWLTGHAGGCWLLNDCPGIARLWRWAIAPKVNGMCATTGVMGYGSGKVSE